MSSVSIVHPPQSKRGFQPRPESQSAVAEPRNTAHWILNTLVLFVLLFATSAHAQQPAAASARFEPASAPAGQQVEYRVTIIASERVQELPNFVAPESLEFVPNGSTTVSVNGQLQSTIRYIVISRFSGDYSVPAFNVEVGGQQLRVPPARLIVTEVGAPGAAGAAAGYEPMHMVLDIPKRDYYVGETIQARLLFIASADEMPTFVQHIDKTSGSVLFKPPRNYITRPGQLKYDGKTANGLSMDVEITPLTEGDIGINCEAMVSVQRLDGMNRRGPYGGGNNVQCPTTTIRVVALPKANRPDGFTGAIGQFSVGQPKLSAAEAEVGEPVMLTFAVTGDGNIDSVPAPSLGDDAQWRAYKPTSDFSADESGKGTKTFTYTLVARQSGKHSTPAIPFAYFDPIKHTFIDQAIPPMSVLVKAAPGTAPSATADVTAAEAAPAPPPPEPEPILTGFAETSGRWTSHLGPDFRLFFYAQLIPPVVLLLAWLWRRRRDYLAAHPEILLRRRARAAARRALSQARTAAQRNDVPAFLLAGTGALCEAATHFRGATAASLTPAEVLRHLAGEEALAARTIFEHADAKRYATTTAAPPRPASLLSGLERAVATLAAQP